MKVLGVLLCMWALSGPCLFSPLEARPGSTFASNISGLSSSSSSSLFSKEEEEEPISLVSSDMEAQSPGMPVLPEVEVVHHQDLNKGILIALIAASSVLGVILLFVSCFMVYRLKSSKKHGAKSKQDTGDNFPNAVKGNSLPILDRFSSLKTAGKKRLVAVMDFQLLEAATNNFRENNALGEGGHGKVYRACFSDKRLAAVKRLEGGDEDIRSEFENEVNWLTKIQHHNIISLLGYCIHGETRYLVYEMMQNGSLESQLHGPMHGSGLSWHLRIKIAVDVARGLEYLHEHCNPTIVHRDLKASNILLDSNFNAKLSDFGLAVTSGVHNKNIKLSGTLGYVAPEYLLDGKLTDKSDVYAYGVVLLELLTGRKPIQKLPGEQYQSIVTWAMPHLTDRSKLSGIVDPVIKDTMDLKHLYQVAAVAVLCVQKEPSYRPLITDVLHSLIPLVPLELGGSLRTTEPVPSAPPSR